jgi:DNA-binding IclR family transcriptional regulator
VNSIWTAAHSTSNRSGPASFSGSRSPAAPTIIGPHPVTNERVIEAAYRVGSPEYTDMVSVRPDDTIPVKLSKTDRAFRILERLTSGEPPPTHADLMRDLGVQRSTLSDSLAELRDLGFVAVRDRRYLPGARLLNFVRRAAEHGDLSAGVRPSLLALAQATGETAVWVIEDGRRADTPGVVVSTDQVESAHPIRYVADIGVPYTMHSTAAGHAFLAFSRRSAHTLAEGSGFDPDELDGELEQARERGFALKVDVTRSTALAAPVHDVHGSIVGVISIVGPTDRLGDAETRVWPLLAAEIARLSAA